MAIVIGNRIGKQIAEALGLQTERLHSIEIRIAPDEIVSACCEYYASDDDGKLVKVLKQYELHERVEQSHICTRCGHDKAKGFCPLTPPGSGCPKEERQ